MSSRLSPPKISTGVDLHNSYEKTQPTGDTVACSTRTMETRNLRVRNILMSTSIIAWKQLQSVLFIRLCPPFQNDRINDFFEQLHKAFISNEYWSHEWPFSAQDIPSHNISKMFHVVEIFHGASDYLSLTRPSITFSSKRAFNRSLRGSLVASESTRSRFTEISSSSAAVDVLRHFQDIFIARRKDQSLLFVFRLPWEK